MKKKVTGVNKTQKVKTHLQNNGIISSWEAIKLYKATRLSAIIFNLKKQGLDISTQIVAKIDENGYDCHYANYILHTKKK
jgi:hypothetical protein